MFVTPLRFLPFWGRGNTMQFPAILSMVIPTGLIWCLILKYIAMAKGNGFMHLTFYIWMGNHDTTVNIWNAAVNCIEQMYSVHMTKCGVDAPFQKRTVCILSLWRHYGSTIVQQTNSLVTDTPYEWLASNGGANNNFTLLI